MGCKQLVGNLLIFRFASEEIEKVDDNANDHDDLHIEVLPVGAEMGGDVDNFDWLLGRRGSGLLLSLVSLGFIVKLIWILMVLIIIEPLEKLVFRTTRPKAL